MIYMYSAGQVNLFTFTYVVDTHSTVHATLTTLSVGRVGPGLLRLGVECSDIKGGYSAFQNNLLRPLLVDYIIEDKQTSAGRYD